MQGLLEMPDGMCSGGFLLKMTIHVFFVYQVSENRTVTVSELQTVGINCVHKNVLLPFKAHHTPTFTP